MFKFNNLFDKEGGGAAVIENKELSKEDVIELLGEDDEEKPLELEKKEIKKEGEEEVKEETDELKELEEELEVPDEEKLELVTPVRKREILAAYPDLFKKFPYLERAYYREQQFTELLPTIDDAKKAVEKSETLDSFERDLNGGNTENILKAVKGTNQKAFDKLVDDYLPTLAKVDNEAYHHVIGNVMKHTIIAMAREAKKSSNSELNEAAQILNQFVFGTSEFTAPTRLSTDDDKKDEKEEKLSQRERELTQRQFDNAREDLSTKVDNVLKATIEGNIDPRESMTDYVRKNAVRESIESLNNLMEKDSRFKVVLDKLWEKAFEDNFSKSSLDRIKSSYLSRAKTLLPDVIKRARNEALKGLGKHVKNDEESSSQKKGPLPAGRSASSSNSSGKSDREKAKEIPREMSTRDFLMQD
jgi:hypothetical protein